MPNFTSISRYRTYFDILIVALFALLGPIPSIVVFLQRKYTFFYQNFTPESVMWACGYGLRHPGHIDRQLASFLLGSSRSFDCAAVDPATVFGPAGVFANLQPHLTWSAALLWRVLGVNQTALLPLVAVFAAAYAVGCYALARLFVGRLLAILAGIVLCLSPVAVEMSLVLRDNSKAAFFVWSVVLLVLALRAQSQRTLLIFAALAGTIVGIGYGFRADLAIVVPIGFMVLAISALAALAVRPSRLLSPMVFLGTSVLFALPVLLHINFAANGGVWAVQGTTETFRDNAGMEPAGYALGWTYSDELTLSEITSAERPKTPEWDAVEGPPIYDVTEAMKHSTSYLLGWAPLFAADFATQALKSAGWVFGFPAFLVRSGQPVVHDAAKLLLPMYQLLAKPWTPLLGIAGFLALLWRVYVRSPIEAVCVFLLLALLAGYPGIQFSMRHLFHLEFVWVVSVLSLVVVALRPAYSLQRARGFGVLVAAAGALIGLSYLGLVAWQRTTLSEQIAVLLAAPREPLTTELSLRDDGSAFHALPVPARHAALVASASDSLTPAIRLTGIAWSVRAEADRLIVTVGGDRCPAGAFAVRLAYDKADDVWQPLDADLSLTRGADGSASAFFPVFYRPTQHFAGIVLPADHAGCSLTLERIDAVSPLPLVMSGDVSDGRLLGPPNKGFGGFSVTAHAGGVIRAAPK